MYTDVLYPKPHGADDLWWVFQFLTIEDLAYLYFKLHVFCSVTLRTNMTPTLQGYDMITAKQAQPGNIKNDILRIHHQKGGIEQETNLGGPQKVAHDG